MVEKPQRIQLSRRKGWRMPENTKKVDRTTRWGNPFVIGSGAMGRHALDHEGAVGFFRDMLADPELRTAAGYPSDDEIRAELAGKNLACWCGGKHCHADALLEVANSAHPLEKDD